MFSAIPNIPVRTALNLTSRTLLHSSSDPDREISKPDMKMIITELESINIYSLKTGELNAHLR